MNLRIRDAVETDSRFIVQLRKDYDEVIADRRPDLYKLAENYTEEEVLHYLNAGESSVIVAETTDHAIVGYTIVNEEQVKEHKIYKERKVVYIRDFCVHEEVRGKGVGQSLIEYILKLAKDRKADAIEIDVLAENDQAEQFLESNGLSTKSKRYELELN
ncbi:GNAT family N-acetyltransferase [Neobacillus mesonae]|nr:GNAT family N-acetyltransferase [Neobacillus mesonae]